jgi:hypothetical protein
MSLGFLYQKKKKRKITKELRKKPYNQREVKKHA